MNKEEYYKFLEEEYNLLTKKEYNAVINDINELIELNIKDIDLSFEKNKKLFSNYKEIVLYCDLEKKEIDDEPLDYDYVTLYGILGDAYFYREMYEESLNAFTKAITLSPANILLIQRRANILIKLNKLDETLKYLIKTIKYCYTSSILISQYFLLIDIFKLKADYKSAIYLLYLIGAAFRETEYIPKEVTKIQELTDTDYYVEDFEVVLEYIKSLNILTPYDLSVYYYSIYNELLKRNELSGALDFLLSSHNMFYDKKNVKLIKKLQKEIKKQK